MLKKISFIANAIHRMKTNQMLSNSNYITGVGLAHHLDLLFKCFVFDFSLLIYLIHVCLTKIITVTPLSKTEKEIENRNNQLYHSHLLKFHCKSKITYKFFLSLPLIIPLFTHPYWFLC